MLFQTTIIGGAIWFHDRLLFVNILGFAVCQIGILWYMFCRTQQNPHLSKTDGTPMDQVLLSKSDSLSMQEQLRAVPESNLEIQ